MSAIYRRVPLASAAKVFVRDAVYRSGTPAMAGRPTAQQALASAVQKVEFLEVPSMKGVPLNGTVTGTTVGSCCFEFGKKHRFWNLYFGTIHVT